MKRVYWDSCCFIDFLQGSKRGEVLKGVVDKKDNGELEIVTSVVTLTEVIKLGKGTVEERDVIIRVFNQDRDTDSHYRADIRAIPGQTRPSLRRTGRT